MGKALLIVDVQNDFTEGGALGVTGGAAVARGISQRLEIEEYDVVIASQDWHDADNDNGGHFATTEPPDFVTTWPVHCVAGTHGAEFHEDLNQDDIDLIVQKGQGKPSYSMFEGITEDGRTVADVFAEFDISEVEVAGLATDYCVRASAIDALGTGVQVTVLTDLIAGVAEESSQAALDEMVERGIDLD